MPPGVMMASAPTTMARSVRPARTMWKAMPSAWAEEAQALDTTKVVPVQP